MRLRWVVACLGMLAVLVAAELARSFAGGPQERAPAPLAAVEDLASDPLAHLGRELRLLVQAQDELARWNPYVTRFGAGDYRAFRAWSDSQCLWRKTDWEAPAATLFARRGSPAERALASAHRYQRLEVTVRVAQVFLGRAWLEVVSASPLRGAIGEGSILHASRAVGLMNEGRWQLALDNLDRASLGDMPEPAREELRRLRERCLRRELP
jgi:hypothetical protein